MTDFQGLVEPLPTDEIIMPYSYSGDEFCDCTWSCDGPARCECNCHQEEDQ